MPTATLAMPTLVRTGWKRRSRNFRKCFGAIRISNRLSRVSNGREPGNKWFCCESWFFQHLIIKIRHLLVQLSTVNRLSSEVEAESFNLLLHHLDFLADVVTLRNLSLVFFDYFDDSLNLCKRKNICLIQKVAGFLDFAR